MIVIVSIMVVFPGRASAAQRLHGVVLAVTPKTGTAIVRHDAFGAMPAMTMPFRILPRARAAQLQPGSQIDADVDASTEPWTLTHVSSTATQALTAAGAPLRRVAALHVGDLVPDTPLVDENGRPFRFSTLRGNDVVLAFIYTRCADARMCPLISAKFRQLQDARAGRDLRLVEVTLDPAYDRPPVLRRYARTFGADPRVWTLLTGDAEPVLNFAAQFGITPVPDPNAGLIHGENTVVIGPEGRIESEIGNTMWSPRDMLARFDRARAREPRVAARSYLWLALMLAAVVYLTYRVVTLSLSKGDRQRTGLPRRDGGSRAAPAPEHAGDHASTGSA